MSKFAIKNIPEIKGVQRFKQLVILEDQIDMSKINLEETDGIWDIYENSLEARYIGSFRGLVAIMDRKANLQPLSDKLFRDITSYKESIKEYEFKYQDLRGYGIKMENAVLMIVGGFKNQQKEDLRKFRSIKKIFLDSIKQQNDKRKSNKK